MWSLWWALLGVGVVQAPLIAALEMMKITWCPPGPERAWSMIVIILGNSMAPDLLGKCVTRHYAFARSLIHLILEKKN